MQRPNLILSQKLKQEQVLTPAQIQSLEILMAPIMELQTKISQELSSNPVLEQEDINSMYGPPPAGVSDDIKPAGSLERGESRAESPDDDDIESFNITGGVNSNKNDDKDIHSIDEDIDGNSDSIRDSLENYSYGENSDEDKMEYFFNSIVDMKTTAEDLQFQLEMLITDEKIKKLAEIIIGNLDDRGYLNIPLQDIALLPGTTFTDLERALDIVQSFDPAGVGARNLKECLLLQLKRKQIKNIITENIIENYLDEIAANHIPQVARKVNISIEELHNALKLIKTLSPYPFTETSGKNDTDIIIPEITIEKDENGQYIVSLEEKYQPRLRISERYLSMLENPSTPPETKEYIRQKISSAGVIIRSIEHRRETIRKLAEVIVDSQYDFLEEGVEYLKPMTMKQVADKIGVHETTVSRAVSGKYARTPQGVYELRYFFSSGYTSDAGDMISNKVVMEKIRNIIDEEDPFSPWPDDVITDKLNKEGIPVARRTIAKYREEMNIPSSRLRRQFR